MNLDGQLQEIIEELLAHGISLDLATKEFEKKYIVGAVKRSSGNLGRAASSLGIHRNTLRNKVGILNSGPGGGTSTLWACPAAGPRP